MNATIQSIAWLLARRHAMAFSSALVSWVIITIGLQYWPDEDIPLGVAVLFSALPIVHLIYAVAIFTFGSDSDLLSPVSTYPTHIMRLPASSASLVAHPLGLGAAFLSVYWTATCLGVLMPLAELRAQEWFGPPRILTPLVWLSTLAWVQAVLWSNHRSLLTRAVGTVAALTLPYVWAGRSLTPSVPEGWAILGLLISIPAGIALAVVNLNLARQGYPGGWFQRHPLADDQASTAATKTTPSDTDAVIFGWRRVIEACLFSNSVRAQAWCDWRRYCFPIAMATVSAMLLFMVLGIVWPSARQARITILFIPPVIGCLAGFGIGGLHEQTSESRVSAFFASLPVTCAQFIAAKWIATVACATFTCMAAIGMFCVATLVADDSVLLDAWQWLRQEFPASQLIFGVIIGLVAYAGLTWVLLIQAIPIKLSGRHWLQAFCIVSLTGIALFAIVVISIEKNGILPWALAVILAIKTCSAVWTLRQLRSLDLVERGVLINLAQFWCLLVVLCIVTLFGFLLPFKPSMIAPMAIVIFLLAPVSRLALAPLALHWNRHR